MWNWQEGKALNICCFKKKDLLLLSFAIEKKIVDLLN